MKESIHVRNLGKRFTIGVREQHNTLRDMLAAKFAVWRSDGLKQRRARPLASTEFWALKDISFSVAQGAAVGIIGANGAGKSTLLKVLSRITEPTIGSATVRGRVGSLLEVGTGFHSELTGRENVFLSGAVLGMRKSEIQRKFDDIVAFAEIDRFIDTPVKRYSSGMYLRLAFAVAAHLEPEILIVDEVLAVGDAEFQKKCIAKMQSLTGQGGRTVLFVSHDMRAIRRLCDSCMLLDGGKLAAVGAPDVIVQQYLSMGGLNAAPGKKIPLRSADQSAGREACFTAASFSKGLPDVEAPIVTDGPIEFELDVYSAADREIGSVAVTFYDFAGTKLVNADLFCTGTNIRLLAGMNHVTVRVESLHLLPGLYPVGLWLADADGNELDRQDQALHVDVVRPDDGFRFRPENDGVVSCELRVVCRAPAEPPAAPAGHDR
jgi:lipopolysaccharide transport system ATP-binding protein